MVVTDRTGGDSCWVVGGAGANFVTSGDDEPGDGASDVEVVVPVVFLGRRKREDMWSILVIVTA